MSDSFSAQFVRSTPVSSFEHAMLSVRGDPQVLLSTYLKRPVDKTIIHAITTAGDVNTASPDEPWTQSRQVILSCGTVPICKATSYVNITNPDLARYWEKATPVAPDSMSIPQAFAKHGTLPKFTLKSVGAQGDTLKRVYRLEADSIEVEIQERFPDREMFALGVNWNCEGLAPHFEEEPAPEQSGVLTHPSAPATPVLSRANSTDSVRDLLPHVSPVTPLENALLANRGDPQVLLSKLLGRRCTKFIKKARSCTRDADSASETNPWTQSRQVHLRCGERVLCYATSFVTITSPLWARAWTSVPSEQITLPGLFAMLGTVPEFTLLGISARGEEIRRTYRVSADGVECEVLERFPDRSMFTLGEDWEVEGLSPRMDSSTCEAIETTHKAIHNIITTWDALDSVSAKGGIRPSLDTTAHQYEVAVV